jgi:hypothetical protein
MIEPQCPRCARPLSPEGGEAWSCEPCNRGFVIESVLLGRVESLTGHRAGRAVALVDAAPGTGDRCPNCAVPMSPGTLDGVVIERCVAHGVWFDRDALSAVLLREAKATDDRRAREDRTGTASGVVGLLVAFLDLFW